MMVKHISIEVTSKQTKSLFSVVRRILLLIFWNRWMVFWIKRGCAALPRRRIPYTFYQRRPAHRYEVSGCWFSCFVLHYSLAPDVFPRALMELALAMKVIREHGDEWNVDVDRIAVSGFSAGGHLACCLGVFWDGEWLYGALG